MFQRRYSCIYVIDYCLSRSHTLVSLEVNFFTKHTSFPDCRDSLWRMCYRILPRFYVCILYDFFTMYGWMHRIEKKSTVRALSRDLHAWVHEHVMKLILHEMYRTECVCINSDNAWIKCAVNISIFNLNKRTNEHSFSETLSQTFTFKIRDAGTGEGLRQLILLPFIRPGKSGKGLLFSIERIALSIKKTVLRENVIVP